MLIQLVQKKSMAWSGLLCLWLGPQMGIDHCCGNFVNMSKIDFHLGSRALDIKVS